MDGASAGRKLGHDGVSQVLIERGACVDIFAAALLGDAHTLSTLLHDDPSLATANGLNNAPPLHVATTPEVAQLLLDRGARLDTVDSNGSTPLASAIGKGAKCSAVAEMLLDGGSPVDPCILAPLGRSDELGRLVDSDPAAANFEGKIGQMAVIGTPLHAAAQHNHSSTIEVLITRGADVNARADSGQTPLHLCSHPEIARLLVEASADPNAKDDEHKTTPLAWAKVGIGIHGESPERQELVSYLEKIMS